MRNGPQKNTIPDLASFTPASSVASTTLESGAQFPLGGTSCHVSGSESKHLQFVERSPLLGQ